MKLGEALKTLKDASILVEKATVQLDTGYIEQQIAVLQKYKEKLVPIGEEIAAALSKKGITPTQFYIGPSEYDGKCILCIGMPRNRWYTVGVYDDGIEINVDGNYEIKATKENYLPKLINALQKKK